MTKMTINTTIELEDINESALDTVISELIKNNEIAVEDAIVAVQGDFSMAFECEFECWIVPYVRATGPSFANAGGDPPEGGYCEDESLLIICDNGESIDVTDLVDPKLIDDLSEEASEEFYED